MAKESMKAREVKRAKLVAKYAEKRAALKQIVRTGDPADAFEAAQKLQELPKNSNPIRMHNRCKLTGRPKGYIRQFGISRIQFREMASNGPSCLPVIPLLFQSFRTLTAEDQFYPAVFS